MGLCRFCSSSFDVITERGFRSASSGEGARSQNQKEMVMKFLSIYKCAERTAPPTQEEMARMGQLIEEEIRAGHLVSTEGCLPSALGARVRLSSGKLSVTDGPFTESKEVVGGFAILNAGSKEEAIALAKKFLHVAGDGECEIRQIFEAGKEMSCVQQAIGA